jgi:hypothetical protein
MSTATTVPVSITPVAAARVAELGMQAELDRMLEHTRQTVAGLLRIEVVLAPPYDTGDEDGITIEAFKKEPYDPSDRTQWDWGTWLVDNFHPDVWRHFAMLIIYLAADAR